MSYPYPFIKISLLGVLSGTEEIFSTSFHITQPDIGITQGQWNSVNATYMENIATAATALWSNADTRIPEAWRLNSIKFAYLGTDGQYIADAKEVELEEVPGGELLGWAPQLALVASIVSIKRKDPGRYNRMYFPTTVASLYGAPYLGTTEQTDFATAVADFFSDVNNISELSLGAGVGVRVMSNKGAGQANTAVEVRAGRVIDTQRRRRNKLQEIYVSSPIS